MQSLIVLASLVSELALRLKISCRPSPEIKASLEKIRFLGSSLKGLREFRLIRKI